MLSDEQLLVWAASQSNDPFAQLLKDLASEILDLRHCDKMTSERQRCLMIASVCYGRVANAQPGNHFAAGYRSAAADIQKMIRDGEEP